MKTNAKITRMAMTGAALAVASLPAAARACDVCMGGKDPTIRPAVNGAIFFMLGVVVLMATGVGCFMRYLAKRARMPMSAYQELLQ